MLLCVLSKTDTVDREEPFCSQWASLADDDNKIHDTNGFTLI